MTPISWVMRITAVSISWVRRRMMRRIWAWMVTSRAVVGSSAMSSFGSHSRAMAIITRWRIPPESWWGYSFTRCSGEGMPTRRSISTHRANASCREMVLSWVRSISIIWSEIR